MANPRATHHLKPGEPKPTFHQLHPCQLLEPHNHKPCELPDCRTSGRHDAVYFPTPETTPAPAWLETLPPDFKIKTLDADEFMNDLERVFSAYNGLIYVTEYHHTGGRIVGPVITVSDNLRGKSVTGAWLKEHAAQLINAIPLVDKILGEETIAPPANCLEKSWCDGNLDFTDDENVTNHFKTSISGLANISANNATMSDEVVLFFEPLEYRAAPMSEVIEKLAEHRDEIQRLIVELEHGRRE